MYSFVRLLLVLGLSIVCCVMSTFKVIFQNISNVDNLSSTEVRPTTAHSGVDRRTHVNGSQPAEWTRHLSNLSSLRSHGLVLVGTTKCSSTSPVNDNDGDIDEDVVVVDDDDGDEVKMVREQ